MLVEFRHGTLCERLLPGEKLPLLRVMRGMWHKAIYPSSVAPRHLLPGEKAYVCPSATVRQIKI